MPTPRQTGQLQCSAVQSVGRSVGSSLNDSDDYDGDDIGPRSSLYLSRRRTVRRLSLSPQVRSASLCRGKCTNLHTPQAAAATGSQSSARVSLVVKLSEDFQLFPSKNNNNKKKLPTDLALHCFQQCKLSSSSRSSSAQSLPECCLSVWMNVCGVDPLWPTTR